MELPRQSRQHILGVVLIAVFVAVAGLSLAPAASAAPGACSVSSANGGINVSWGADSEAVTYVYRLEVEGENNRYDRVAETSTLISLPEGKTGTVFVSAVRADGSYSPSVSCGSGKALEGTGGGGDKPTCTASNGNGGADVRWSAIAGAVNYVYRIEANGGLPRFRVADGTQVLIPLDEGVVASIFVSAKFADGRYSPAVSCGSAQANEGTGGPGGPGDTCNLSNVTSSSVDVTWSSVPGATRYVYRAEVDGRPNRYFSSTTTTSTYRDAPGTNVSIAVSAQLANGRYTPAVNCGNVTLTDDSGLPDPVSCVATATNRTAVTVEWHEVPRSQGFTISYQILRGNIPREVAVNDGNATQFSFEASDQPTTVWVLTGERGINGPFGTKCRLIIDNNLPNPETCVATVTNRTAVSVEWDEVPRSQGFSISYQILRGNVPREVAVNDGNATQFSFEASSEPTAVWVLTGERGINGPFGTKCELVRA